MIRLGHKIRFLAILIVLFASFGGLGARLYYIQIVRHEFFKEYFDKHHLAKTLLYPTRGTIYDRNGKILAMSRRTSAVFINPRLINDAEKTRDPEVVIKSLAQILDLDKDVVRARSTAKTSNGKYCMEVMLKRKPSDRELEDLDAFLRDQSNFAVPTPGDKPSKWSIYKGVYLRDRDERVYPSDQVLCHVLGYMRDEEQPNTTLIRDDIRPQRGVELAFNKGLRGTEGWRLSEVDKIRRSVISENNREQPAVNGYNLQLSIDINIQYIVEKEIETAVNEIEFDSCSIVVMDPWTGEILAMAGYPSFNANKITELNEEAIRNHPTETIYEPGSTMKALVGALAIDKGLVDLDTVFFCENGAMRIPGGHILHDSHGYGDLTFFDIIMKSSNIGIAKVAQLLGDEALYEGLVSYGFGQSTGVGILEEKGIFKPVGQWWRTSIYMLPMGQEISVTSLQLATAYCALANGGNLMKPILVRKITDENGNPIKVAEPQIVRRVLSKEATEKMKGPLQAVVSAEGTARKADIEGYTEAGKTGTAQKVVDGRYSHTIFDSGFAGFAPLNDPRIVIVVTLNGTRKPNHYGGTVAAPIFSRIGEQVLKYLEVAKDAPDEIDTRAANR